MPQSALAEMYAKADLFVLPSIWDDPGPLVGIEALSFGAPLAGFAVGGIPDYLIDGQTGVLVNEVGAHDLHEELRQQSTHDALTGLYNRRFMHKRLLEEAAKLDRHPDQPFAVVLADIDHFKSINDTLGHDMGDTVLTEVSRRFLSHLRQYDVCARWGGEEFLLLLPSTTADQAFRVCEHLRHVMADTLEDSATGADAGIVRVHGSRKALASPPT